MHAKFCPPMISHANHLGEDIMERCGKTKDDLGHDDLGRKQGSRNSGSSFTFTGKRLPPRHHIKVHISMDTSVLYTLPHIDEKDFNFRFRPPQSKKGLI